MNLANKEIHLDISMNNQFVQNHFVQGQAILPGLAYIDMLYQIARTNGFDIQKTVLKNLSIYNPLLVGNDLSVDLILIFEEIQGIWKVMIQGIEKKIGGTGDPNIKKYISAEFHRDQTVSFNQVIDPDAIKSNNQSIISLEEKIYAPARKNGLVHQDIMKAEGMIYCSNGDYIANIALPLNYRMDAGDYLFHPTLLDGSAMASSIVVQGILSPQLFKQRNSLFLPIFFEFFSASESLNSEIYARVPLSTVELIKDIIYCDIEFFNNEGKQVGILKRLTSKLVRKDDQISTANVKKISVPTHSINETISDAKIMPNALKSRVINIFSRYLSLPPDQIELRKGFFDLGLESVHLLEIVKELEILLDTTLNPTLMFEYDNLQELIGFLENTFINSGSHLGENFQPLLSQPGRIYARDKYFEDKFSIPTDFEETVYEFYYQEPYLQDHLVFGKPALMGITHPSCVIEELLRKGESLPIQLDRLQFIGGPVTPGENVVVHVGVVFEEKDGQTNFKSEHYLSDPNKIKPCLNGQYIKPGDISYGNIDIQALLNHGKRLSSSDLAAIYDSIDDIKIGDMLKTIEEAYLIDQTTMVIKVNLTGKEKKGNLDSFVFDPLVLNSCYFSCAFDHAKDIVFIPLMIESLRVFKQPTEICYIITTVNKATSDYASFDSVIVNGTGEIAAQVINASVKSVENPEKLANATFDSNQELVTAGNKSAAQPKANETAIAIIGISGRYPRARNLEEFWLNLRDGKDCITEIPKDRWDYSLYFDDDRNKLGKTYSKWGGFLDEVDRFDPLFFNISPREAEIMDPQERLFLECVYETLEDAGYTRESIGKDHDIGLGAKVGVFVGVMNEEYQLYGAQEQIQGRPIALSGNISSVANRVSYFCNFQGPSVAMDTMCSSSLTAIHFACQSIIHGGCELAVAGGVNVLVHPNKYLLLSQGKFVSSKGYCESFGSGGDGYVPGEGVGAVLLKPLSKAIADSDHIYGIIKGTAINHGGKTGGYSVPNPNSQAEVIRQALGEAGVNPQVISYLEAHGTGTSLGDPIEIAGLTKAFGEYASYKQFCAIGSAKSNIGHCESAAGIAGITKILLQMKNRQIVPSLHSEELNPNIDFLNTPFIVQQELTEWERPVISIDGVTSEYPRIAGISSFGAGGSNAHVVIEEYISGVQELLTIKVNTQNPAIVVLSARNEERLQEQAKRLLDVIQKRGITDDDLANLAYTLQVGREAMEERLGLIISSIEQLAGKLTAFLAGENGIEDLYRGQVKRNQEDITVFTVDEDLQKAIESWVKKGKYGKLLNLWVKGMVFDWNRLYKENKPQRISLPTYPFAKERYWAPVIEIKPGKERNLIMETIKSPKLEKAVLIKDWQPKEIKVEFDNNLTGVILILGTVKTTKLALSVFQDNETLKVIPVIHGETDITSGIITDFYSSSAGDELYQKIKIELKEARLTGVIDLTAYDDEYEQSTVLEAGKLSFLQKLVANERRHGYCLMQVTYRLNLLEITKTTMQGARLAGLYRMLGTEYQQIKTLTMDTDCPFNFYKKAAKQIQMEFIYRVREDYSECCYRNEIRYEPILKTIRNEKEIQAESRIPARYQPEEVVLITGGSRGIGASVAEHVISQGGKNLIIIGREELPEQSAWKMMIAKQENPELTEKLKRLQLYIECGVKVRYYNTSLCDETEIRMMVEKTHQELGSITGVFHCAGRGSKTPIFFEKPLSEMEAVCEPKMSGLVTLHQALAEEPLRFFILFSSISGIAPTLAVGQSDYAMANAYMDYYAMNQAGQGKTYLKSAQWPAWGETGMAAGGMKTPAYLNTGLASHSTTDGLRLLDVIKQGSYTISVPCVMTPDQFIPNQLLQTKLLPNKKESGLIINRKPVFKPTGKTQELRVTIREWLKEIFVSKLKLGNDQWDSSKTFDEYGVDSIILAQLVTAMQDRVTQSLDPSLLLQYRTTDELTEYFALQHGKSFGAVDQFETETATEIMAEAEDDINGHNFYEPVSRGPRFEYPEIAIIGIACRFPGSPDKEAYWDLLSRGITAIKPVPQERWDSIGNRHDYGGWIDEIDLFDAKFFNINEKDAAVMDPQARIALEESLKAIYDAGYDHKQLSGRKIGVYIGGRLQPNLDPATILQVPNPILGIGQNYMAANISRFFNFTGPSMVVDTACSSGLTGISIAAEALLSGQIEMALVGAVNLLLNPSAFEMFAARNILSKNGEFHIFEEQSGGEVLGEGAGVVIIKRLDDAIRDGNLIYGVIKSIAVNNDGRTIGPGSPNIASQKQVIEEALALSGKSIEEIGYIEVNGGGSPVVDAVEIKSIAETYRLDSQNLGPCYLGSIKPNIGHLLLTSGMAELIRCVLSIYYKRIPPFLSAREPFPYYDFGRSRIRFNREIIDWEVPASRKRVAALNSFPDGGTNCHLIIEEFVPDLLSYQPLFIPKELPALNRKSLQMPQLLKTNPEKTETLITKWGEYHKTQNRLRSQLSIDNPFVKNHIVQGQAVLPGLAYIDMLFQIGQTCGFNIHQTVLKNLTIFNPLIIRVDSPVELIISVTESQAGWEIVVEGFEQRTAGMGVQNRKKYISAQLHHEPSVFFNQSIDIGEIKTESRLESKLVLEEVVYQPARQNGLVHRDIMKPEGAVYVTDQDCITSLTLPLNQADGIGDYLFHPALIDGSAMASSVAIGRILSGQIPEEQKELFLPIFFESFSASELLNTECYARVPVSTVELIKDVFYYDIEFFNNEGKQIGILKRLTTKRVRSGDQIAVAATKSLPVSKPFITETPVTVQRGTDSLKHLQHKVTRIFSRYLSLRPDQIDSQTGFFALGLESVHLLEIVKELEKLLNRTLNPTLMFEYNSIQELIAFFETELGLPSELQDLDDLQESGYEFYYHEPYLQDHLVFGKPALMGITHPACVIEELLQRRELLPIQLDRLQFIGGPVTPRENEIIHIRVVFEEEEGQVHFRSEHYLNNTNQVKPCLIGQYVASQDKSYENIDIQAVIKQGKRMSQSDLDRIYHSTPDFKIGEMLKTITEGYLIDQQTMLIKVDLTGKKMKGNRESFVFDPLLLNSCYYIAGIFDNGRKDTIFVPLMIESLRVFSPITEISYIITNVNKTTSDYASFNSMIINDSGEIAAKVINASLKSVQDPARLENATFDLAEDLIPAVQKVAVEPKINQTEIAVIGVSGRYPQARNLEEFWKNLRDGKDCITEIPKERWDHSQYFDDDQTKPGKTYSKWGGFLEGVDQFDPLFFNISPQEAEYMDPQERLFLECVYETMEDAGYIRKALTKNHNSSLGGKVGVFVGAAYEEYQLYGAQLQVQGYPIALSGNPASIANRVSYFCNFHGPSIVVDTMCSSSLTAIHLACRSIRQGECELAIAGGVNVLIHPNKYLMLSQGKFASSKGRCESFGLGGDGYVPGEGVGAVLLKPLSKAIADEDQIYGIIKGTAINHGGKASGYTVPNPSAQAEVISLALEEAGINPRAISYFEAHGTGTSLGDPIEITGITKAFQKYTKDQQYCAIGSAKSNIGHCEGAAGIAGLTKVLLQLKNHQIVPSLHSEVLNPNIDFTNTPFIVQQTLTKWKRPIITIEGLTKEYLRIAGISGFGAGGANAHIIIQEYCPENRAESSVRVSFQNPAIIVLSAKDEERLKEQALRILTAIEERQFSDADLANIAYTLQIGREAMEERLAISVGSIRELSQKLHGFLEVREGDIDLFRGQVKQNKDTLALLAVDEDMAKTINAWIYKKEYTKLLDLWAKGLEFDWNRLYGEKKPRRISLPPYPFAKERYWVPELELMGRGAINTGTTTYIHPLLQTNISDLTEQRYGSTFTGKEFFIKDYNINGRRGLPGAANLEMARMAVTAALDHETATTLKESQATIHLKDIIWDQPLFVGDQPVPVHIRLSPESNGEIIYQICSSTAMDGASSEPVIYCQGRAIVAKITGPPIFDLNAVKAKCNREMISTAQIYDLFTKIGIEYGLGYQAIEQMYIGADQVLAKLSIPADLLETQDQYILHPSLLEAALQAATRFMMGPNRAMLLPETLQELETFGRCNSVMWAVIRYSQGDETKIDIDLCDDRGTVLVKMKGYSTRILMEQETPEQPSAPMIKKMLFQIEWKEQTVSKDAPLAEYNQHLIILCEMEERCTPEQIQEQMGNGNNLRCFALQSKNNKIDQRFQYYTIRIFEEIRKIFENQPEEKVLIQIVYPGQGEQRLFSALSGILNTARVENPRITGQMIEIEPGEDSLSLGAKLKENLGAPADAFVRYQAGIRLISGWSQMEVSLEDDAEKVRKPWRDRGIYLITGGTGGLGLIFAEEIAAGTKEAVIILTGRSSLNPDKHARIKKIEAIGAKVVYEQVNVSDKKEIQALIQRITKEYGGINGVIHSAGLIRDNYIIKKTKEEIKEVLEPKVTGLINLDEASRDLNLDFLILFSSRAAVTGNQGQADYATANAFMDAFAGYRNNLVASNQRHGRTLAMNWPFWKEALQVNAEVEKLWQTMGMAPMETQTGMRALYQGLLSGNDQVIVLVEDIRQIAALHRSRQTDNGSAGRSAVTKGRRPELRGLSIEQCLEWELKYFIYCLLKIPREKLDNRKNLTEFGFNSIGLTQLAIQLGKYFGIPEITPAMFFKYATIESIVEYFLTKHQALLENFYKESITDDVRIGTVAPSKLPAISHPKRLIQDSFRSVRFAARDNSAEPIAIIGMSGRFPGTRNIEELWRVFAEGQDMVKEIPEERFDWRPYYSNLPEPGKTICKWLGCIPGVREFDPLFFEISPREAEAMDPRERLLLQEAWKALEDAGYGQEQFKNQKIGMFVGVEQGDYQLLLTGEVSPPNSILAARLAYFLNFRGPVMAIDTACSSGLVAAHQGILSLRNGECDTAVIAGVNLFLTPQPLIGMSQLGMFSPDGKCYTFDKRANGLVPGEAVAVVVLKRLSYAEADGDPIYAVIKGNGINYDGKTNGITAPSGGAQSSLMKEVYDQYRINPEEIDYIVTHGTGTKLGDPVEINALDDVFKDYTKKQNFCALTSTKTNLGHTMAASGLVSLISLVQALRHEMIPASLHCEQENEYINWQESPFYINKTNKSWPAEGKIRTGAVSAFGASGTNAHLVVQDYFPKKDVTPKSILPSPYYLLALSAKTKESLQEKVKDMIEVLQNKDHQEQNLTQISYTLLKGRQHFNHRCALVVRDQADAIYVLKQAGVKEKLPNLFQGEVSLDFKGHKVIEEYIQDQLKMIQTASKNRVNYQEMLYSLADLYCQGYEIDWNLLFGDTKPQRIHLPTYPFSGEHYWVPESKEAPESAQTLRRVIDRSPQPTIHPLLHQNTSNLSELQFSSTFTGREFFLSKHLVWGQKVLPGLACLEMARAAVVSVLNGITFKTGEAGSLAEDRKVIKFRNVVWTQPIALGEEPIQIHIGIYPDDSCFGGSYFEDTIGYEIYGLGENGEGETVVYSQGSVTLAEVTPNPALDLKVLQAECNRMILSGIEIYNEYKTIGHEYGPEYQGIEKIYVGQELVLAKLSLPSSVALTKEEFVLHPSIMDAALQAVIGFNMGSEDGNLTETLKPMLPVALQEMEIISNTTSSMWALLRSDEESKIDTKIGKLDIEICDEQGRVCVRLKGLELQENTESSIQNVFTSDSQESYELMTFEEVWQEQAGVELSQVNPGTIVCFLSTPRMQQEMIETLTVFAEPAKLIFISQGTEYHKQTPQNYSIPRADRNSYDEAFRSIRADYGEIDAMLYMWTLEDLSCIKDYSCIVHIIQAVAAAKLKTKRVLLAANFEKDSLEHCYLESWIGFERSLGALLPNTQLTAIYQIIEAGQSKDIKDWGRKIWDELHVSKVCSILYQDGKRYAYQIRSETIPTADSLLKSGGTYLITGGCGGLGFLFAKYVAQKHLVNLVLTGRSAMDAEKQRKIKILEDLGSQVIYLQANISNSNAMKVRLKQVKERFGRIDGVIHAAGIVRTQSILEKRMDDFEKVVEPKIEGTQVLDKVLGEEPLDFVCYFSSSSAILGDFGLCDYAIGNRFLMAYAHYRNRQVSQGLCRGKTVAINWPLWREGGMGLGNDENTKLYLKTSGQRVLETEEGMAILDQILGQNGAQYLIIAGQPSQVHRFLGLTVEERPAVPKVINSSSPEKRRRNEMKGLSIEQCLEWDLKGFINRLLKIPYEKIDLQKNLADFGFNSLGLTQFAIQITKNLGIETTPALFFGYPTVEKLVQYFLEKYPEIISELYREADVADVGKIVQTKMPIRASERLQTPRIKRTGFSMNNAENQQEPIAIIGMSGRFPGARNIDELWTILATGKDMVQEIPEERFDWRQYYGDPTEPGKMNCKWCGCIPGVSEFEPLFFDISPKEAETMDPRQRLLLQEAWRALEDAGYGSEQIKRERIGMFVGVEQGDYQILTQGVGSMLSNNNAILAARLSYFLNLNGPVMAIDTACSSGLVAAHQAILNLRTGECDAAIAAGVNLLLAPASYIGMSQTGMLSEDGKCFTFDKRANGMVPGEAVAVVILKLLSRAEADGDPVYAVIKASGTNFDGKTNGITAPNGVAQTNLLKKIYEQYRINREDMEYIVAHGTGTRLGDPIEVNALNDAFKGYTNKQNYCALTSTKTNFGHTSAPSGLVSLISLVQALRYETIPASLHCEQENDYINWEGSPFFVNKTNKPWPTNGRPRYGAVSAFGMSGTNAHMVVQSYSDGDDQHISQDQAPYYLLAFSAKTPEALDEKIADLIIILQTKEIHRYNLAQISYTLLNGRQHFNHRCAVVVQDWDNAVDVLKRVGSKEKLPNLFQGKVPRDFIGQTATQQYVHDLLKKGQAPNGAPAKYREILSALADLYCQGYLIDWKQLFGDMKMKRIHLPTYPFGKEHYWIDESYGILKPEAISEKIIQVKKETPPLQNNLEFYEQLLDEVLNNRISSDHAVRKVKSLLGIPSEDVS